MQVVVEHFGAIAALALALAAFTALRFYQVSWIGERITSDLRIAVYANVLRQRPAFFETLQTGEVLSRLAADATLVQTVIGSSASMGLRSAVTAVGALLLLIAIHPVLVLSVAAVLAGFVIPLILIGRQLRRLSRASQDRLADTSAAASEVLEAIGLVQSYGREADEAGRYANAVERSFDAARRRFSVRAGMTAFAIAVVFLGNLYGLYLGVAAVNEGRISAGTLSQIALLIAMLASSAAVLAEVWGDLLRATGALERLMELLDARPPEAMPASEEVQASEAMPASEAVLASEPIEAAAPSRTGDALPASAAVVPHGAVQAGEAGHRPPPIAERRPIALRFEHVDFRYPSRPDAVALQDFSLAIAAGSTVALVGASGAGKSTVFRLLQRFYEVDAGRIVADDQVLADLPLAEVRALFALVAQVDIDPTRLGRRTRLDVAVVGDVGETVRGLLPLVDEARSRRFLDSMRKKHVKAMSGVVGAYKGKSAETLVPIHPEYLADVLDQEAADDAVFTVDTGMCNVWAARYITPNGRRRVIGSFLHGSMANAVPHAIGAAKSSPGRQVIAMAGDGGLAMLLGELITIKALDLPVKIVLFDNATLGMVRLEMLVEGLPSYGTDSPEVDYAQVADAIGIPAVRVTDPKDVRGALREAFDRPGPALVDVVTDPRALSIPPSITAEQVRGFAVAMSKEVLGGGLGEVVSMARSNLRNVPKP